MRCCRLQNNLTRAFHRGLIAAASLAYVVMAVGMPLPTGTPKDRSVAFPCMDRPCGCHDAAGCKEHCCCFTSQQKLAWAARHGIDPTPFVNPAAMAATRSCCVSHQSQADANKGSEFKVQDSASAIDAQPSDDEGAISIVAYRACHGLAPLWTALGAALPPPSPVAYEFLWDSSQSFARPPIIAATLSFSPPTPPPRG